MQEVAGGHVAPGKYYWQLILMVDRDDGSDDLIRGKD